MIQIETKEGVQNVDAIAAVDGIGELYTLLVHCQHDLTAPLVVDCLFIGPYDLSLSLGYPPPSPDPHPDVEVIIQDILKVAHKAGKKW